MVVVAEELRNGLVATEPRGGTTGLADQGPELAVPEAEESMLLEDGGHDRERSTGSMARRCGEWDLHLTLDEFDGGEE